MVDNRMNDYCIYYTLCPAPVDVRRSGSPRPVRAYQLLIDGVVIDEIRKNLYLLIAPQRTSGAAQPLPRIFRVDELPWEAARNVTRIWMTFSGRAAANIASIKNTL
jgi:hypothetical protein